MREGRRQRRERKKVERQHRREHKQRERQLRRAHHKADLRRRAKRRIKSVVRKAGLTAALTLSATRPGVPDPRGASGLLQSAAMATLPDLPLAGDLPPRLVLELPRPRLVPSTNSTFDAHIEAAARKHGVAVELVRAIIQIESGFEPRARSSKGARGLMQLMPATARDMGARNAFDPRQNIFAGARYLRFLLDMFDGNVTLATAAYNGGLTNVQRYRGVPPFPETRDYVEKVHALLGLGPPNLAPQPQVMEALLSLPGGASAGEEDRGPLRSD